MAAISNDNKTSPDPTLLLLRAILLVLIDSREAEATKPEILLRRAGLSYPEIAKLLDKKEDAVQKAVSRAK